MSMTGHKVESEFNKYVNMNATETAEGEGAGWPPIRARISS